MQRPINHADLRTRPSTEPDFLRFLWRPVDLRSKLVLAILGLGGYATVIMLAVLINPRLGYLAFAVGPSVCVSAILFNLLYMLGSNIVTFLSSPSGSDNSEGGEDGGEDGAN
jgi:membrane protein implicated in regulation of membrane protease activity